MKVYVTGRSGTGKSSIARALAEQGIASIDIADGLCHWENKHTGEYAEWEQGSSDEWHDAHAWVCDTEQLQKQLLAHKDIAIVGAAANQDDYLGLFDKVFVLQGDPKTMLARIQARTDNDFGKHETEQRGILKEFGKFESRMVEKGATPVDVSRPLEEVVADIRSSFS